MATLEYLTGNKQIRYPFKPNATLSSVDGYNLDDTFFLDAVLVPFHKDAKRAYLSYVHNNFSTEVFTFTIKILDADENVLNTVTTTVNYNDVNEHEFFVIDTATLAAKLVAGAGLIALKSLSTKASNFLLSSTEFSSSAVILPMPVVTSISVYNKINNIDPPDLIISANSLEISFLEGTNLSFSETDGWAVIPGAGAGLYNPCVIDSVLSINGIKPDKYQNFSVSGNPCYTVNKEGSYGIFVDNVCSPNCSTEQINGFAHYLNRVSDGTNDLVDVIDTIRTQIADLITNYYTVTLPYRNSPTFKVKVARTITPSGCIVYSFSVALNNPYNSAIFFLFNTTITNGTIVGTSTFTSHNDTDTVAVVDGYTDMLECKTQGIMHFNVYATPSTIMTISITVDSSDMVPLLSEDGFELLDENSELLITELDGIIGNFRAIGESVFNLPG